MWDDGQVTKDTKAKANVFSLKDILVAQALTFYAYILGPFS